MQSDKDSPGVFLRETPGGFTVKYLERYLYPRENPGAAVEKKARSLSLLPGTLYLLPSPLLYYGLDILFDRLPGDSGLILMEIIPALAEMSQKVRNEKGIPAAIQRLPLLTSFEALETHLETLDFSRFRRVELISLSGGYALESAAYRKILSFIEFRIQNYWKNRATLIQMGGLWIRNLFTNLSLLPRGVPLSALLTGKPVLVLGAGESAEPILDEIHTLRGLIFVLATDTALPSLLDSGIIPDAVAALEGQHANLYDFFNLENRRIPLLCDLTSSPALLHRYPGPFSFFLSRFDNLKLFVKLDEAGLCPPLLPPLGSVGIAALYLAQKLTRRGVFFAGLDFSFRPGKTHARSTPVHVRRLIETGRTNGLPDFSHGFDPPLRKIRGKNEEMVLSTPNLMEYASLLQNLDIHSRFMDLGSSGIPLGIPRALGLAQALKVTENSRFSSPVPFSPRDQPDIKTMDVLSFYEEEICGLTLLLEKGYHRLNQGEEPEISRLLSHLMEERDYLSVSFPDRSQKNQFSESYLKRVLTYAGYYRERLIREKKAL